MFEDDDQQHEKRLLRNQLIAFAVIGALLFIYFNYFVPKPPPRSAVPPPTAQTQPADTPSSTPAAELPAETPLQTAEAEAGVALPPVPEAVDPQTDEITLENDYLRLTFTRIGARLKQAEVLHLGENGSASTQPLVPQASGKPDTQAVYPLGLSFPGGTLGDALNSRRWDLAERTDRSATFEITAPGFATVRKTFSLADSPHVIEARVSYQNLAPEPQPLGMDQTPAYVLTWEPNITSQDETRGIQQTLVWRSGTSGTNETLATAKLDEQPHSIPQTEWIAVRSAYFVVAMKPEFAPAQAWARLRPDADGFRFGAAVPSSEVAPGAVVNADFRLYVGPSRIDYLTSAWESLPTLQRFYGNNIMNSFSFLLLHILNWFHDNLVTNYGIGIILLTVLVRVILFPLSIKQIKSMKRMQLLAPEMQALKEKYGEDPQELNKRMMLLYRERGVNPLGGCLPVLLQMPVFIALWRMLSSAYELRGAHFFLWIDDLSEPDRLLHLPWMVQVPLFGQTFEYFNLLPILMGLSMVVSTKVVPMTTPMQNPQQKMIMMLMPIVFSFFCYTLPSGLSLYMLTSTVLGIAQQLVTNNMNVNLEVTKKRPPRKRQNFYAAAQARRRRLAKAAKQGNKR